MASRTFYTITKIIIIKIILEKHAIYKLGKLKNAEVQLKKKRLNSILISIELMWLNIVLKREFCIEFNNIALVGLHFAVENLQSEYLFP